MFILLSLIRDLGKLVGVVFVLGLLMCGFYLVKPEGHFKVRTDKNKTEMNVSTPKPAAFEEIKFRACDKDCKGPFLYFTVRDGNLKISPLVKSSWNYKVGRLVYFGDEVDPIGFELTLTSFDGSDVRHVLLHRDRPKFHTLWSYKVRYGDAGNVENIRQIIKAAKGNILCFEEL